MNTIITIAQILIDTCAMLNIVLIVEVLFGASMATDRRKYAIATAIYFIIECVLELTLGVAYSMPITFVEYGMMFIIAFCFATKKRFRTGLMTFPAVFCYVQWCFIISLIEMLFGLDKYCITVNGSDMRPSDFVVDITLLFLLMYIRKVLKKKDFKVSMTLPELVIITLYCMFSPVMITIFERLESVFDYVVYNIMWVLFVLILNLAVIYAIYHRKKARYYRELSSTYKKQFDDEYTYFKNYKITNQDMMSFRHDWNNHMIVMQDLFEQGKYEEAQKYFEAFPNVKKRKYKKIISGNETVDTILAAKEDKFGENQIEVVFDGNLSSIQNMKPVDICILFSNLIDNAIEELVKVQGKRYFHINVTESLNLTMIIFKNNMAGELIRSGDEIKTSKADSINHGIGLQNVKDIVAKYHGEYSLETDGNEFVTKVILPRIWND